MKIAVTSRMDLQMYVSWIRNNPELLEPTVRNFKKEAYQNGLDNFSVKTDDNGYRVFVIAKRQDDTDNREYA